ncbi:MAG: hypothetical protein KC477_13205, partial [Oceanospirillaceae bacterium]|nr:hypothetical protein [Oceanospirillaceae bacterium]
MQNQVPGMCSASMEQTAEKSVENAGVVVRRKPLITALSLAMMGSLPVPVVAADEVMQTLVVTASRA